MHERAVVVVAVCVDFAKLPRVGVQKLARSVAAHPVRARISSCRWMNFLAFEHLAVVAFLAVVIVPFFRIYGGSCWVWLPAGRLLMLSEGCW